MASIADGKQLVWKAEVTFQGTVDDFKALAHAMAAHKISISTGESFGQLGTHAGYMRPVDVQTIVSQRELEIMQKDATSVPLPAIIAGGIRAPHFHMGQDVLLVSKEQVKAFLGEIAGQLTEEEVAAKAAQ